MTTNYDSIAEQYQRSKLQPWRTFVECFTMLRLIGDPTGLAALDLACGEGFYTRQLRRGGAMRVTGVDLSQSMIDLARAQESQDRLGIDYLVGDAKQFSATEEFDLVVAAYLLNYAHDRPELQQTCDAIARSLKPDGRFVTVNTNPATHFPTAPCYRKYGFETCVGGDWKEGAPIRWKIHLSDAPFEIENYYLNQEAHETAFRQAGFHSVVWHGLQVSPEGLRIADQEYWSTLLDHPPVIFIECRK